MHLIPTSLSTLRLLVAGDLAGTERDSGLIFDARVWPDDAEMREGLSVHLSACERSEADALWRVYLIADDNDAALGHAGFKGGPTRGGELEIYWCVEPRWRRCGIATKAAASLCRFAFENPAVMSITATIARHNIASQHVAVALGMFNAGEMKHGMPLWRVAREAWHPATVLNGDPPPEIVLRTASG
ncbi:MAG: GNAT family N-acetyltransferase [Betaproteobacteria bacterium]